jgi:thioredoxin-dependent peroxiredoxin
MLGVGDLAPEFTLPDENDVPVTLSSLLSTGPLVLYFYPADFTPVCTMQACAFRDRYSDVTKAGVRIVGISPQSAASHRRFRDMFSLPFTLLNDAGHQVIKAYGVEGFFGLGVRRATFLIGEDRRIRERVVADLLLGSHMDLIREVVARRQSA